MPPTKPSPPPMRSSTSISRGSTTCQFSPSSMIAPHMWRLVLIHLAQRRAENLRVGVGLLHPPDHLLEAFDLGGQVLAAGLGAFDPQAELEVFLVAHQDVGDPGDLGEDFAQFLLAALPERSAVVQVEGDAGVILFGGARQRQAELAASRATAPRSGRRGGRSARLPCRRCGPGRNL